MPPRRSSSRLRASATQNSNETQKENQTNAVTRKATSKSQKAPKRLKPAAHGNRRYNQHGQRLTKDGRIDKRYLRKKPQPAISKQTKTTKASRKKKVLKNAKPADQATPEPTTSTRRTSKRTRRTRSQTSKQQKRQQETSDDEEEEEEEEEDEEEETVASVAELTADACQRLLEHKVQSPLMQIVQIWRFFPDEDFENATTMRKSATGDAFDVVLSDGKQKMKCLLSPLYNLSVKRGEIRCYDLVQIHDYVLQYNELVIGAPPIVIITSLEVKERRDSEELPIIITLSPTSDDEPSVMLTKSDNQLVAARSGDFPDDVDAPLFGTNAYYIALNDNDTPVGKQWRAYDLVNAPQDYVVDIDQPSIKNIVSKVGQRRENLPERFVGRIVAKTNLVHFRASNANVMPFQFTMDVADGSTTATVVVWGSRCVQYFHTLQLGHIISIENYVLKRSKLTAPTVDMSMRNKGALVGNNVTGALQAGRSVEQLTIRPVEIVVNSSSPPGLIYIVPPRRVKASIPPMMLSLCSTKAMARGTRFMEFDFVGVVVFVGRFESELVANNSNKVHMYRWLRLRDVSSQTLLCVKWHCNGRADVLHSFEVGQCVGLTHVKLLVVPSNESGVAYARSTFKSQLLTAMALRTQARVQADVADLLAWSSSIGAAHWFSMMPLRPKHHAVFVTPPLDWSLADYQQLVDAKLVLLTKLAEIASEMQFLQQRTVLVQACIAKLKAVHEIAPATHTSTPLRKTRRSKKNKKNTNNNNDDDDNDNDNENDDDNENQNEDAQTTFHDVEVELVDFNETQRVSLIIPEAAYARVERRGADADSDVIAHLTNEFKEFAQRHSQLKDDDLAALFRADADDDDTVRSRRLVVAISLCREMSGFSSAVVGMFDVDSVVSNNSNTAQ